MLKHSNDLLSDEEAALSEKNCYVWNILLFIKPESISLLPPSISLSFSAFWINSTDFFFVFKCKQSLFILGLTKYKSLMPTDTRRLKNKT